MYLFTMGDEYASVKEKNSDKIRNNDDEVISFTLKDVAYWTVADVKSYAMTRSLSPDCSIGLANRIADVFSFIEFNAIDGIKLIWLVSPPFETPPATNVPQIAGKLKNLDRKLWKGVRWKDLLEPISTLREAPDGTRLELRTRGDMTLVIPEVSICEGVREVYNYGDRVYSMKMYE